MYDLEKIREIPILDVARNLGLDIRKRGTAYKALCPWHDDHAPSMQIGGKRNICHCYACGESADVIKLIMKVRDGEFVEACRWLESFYPFIRDDYHEDERQRRNSLRELKALVRKTNTRTDAEPFMVFDYDFLNDNMSLDNSFCRCMAEVFGEERAKEVMRKYYLASLGAAGRYADVVFPLIDRRGLIRDMKVQAYDCDNRSARFFHNTGLCYWYGGKYFKDAHFDRNCLFGEHLLGGVGVVGVGLVILVESPKNACVGAAAYPQYTWVATGNKGMLKRSVLEVLRGRTVIVFPDEDAYDEWAEKLETMRDIACFIIQHTPGEGAKRDIADWIITASC